jgi:hypothetical protein
MRTFLRSTLVLLFLLNACAPGGSSPSGTTASQKTSSGASADYNQMSVTVGQDPGCLNANEPCVSVTICVPGTQNCQTIGGILLDTGSFGLRVFSSALTLSLPDSGLAECAYFGSGTTFGPVSSVDLTMGSEPFVTVPMQIINANYSGQTVSSNVCGSSLDTSPSEAGFRGVLGVGLFTHDCGIYCRVMMESSV